jgi:CHAT domain-containing protein
VPLHAAGTKTDTCSDYFVSSYTPTLSALLEARRDLRPISRDEVRILAAAAAQGYDLPPLWAVHAEIEAIRKVVPSTSLISFNDDIDPRRDNTSNEIYAQLPDANIVHFACHGIQDSADPLRSGFSLGDGRITVRDLTGLRLDKAFLAFLSACETAKGLSVLPEEAFHLCATMLYTGFRSVIGTMWYVFRFSLAQFVPFLTAI